MKLLAVLLLSAILAYPQSLLENWASARNAIDTSTPIWNVYTSTGGGGNFCTTQTWNISGGTGNDVVGNNSCPYFNMVIGNEAGTTGGYNYPNGYAQAYITTGSWVSTYNRLTYSMTCGTTQPLSTSDNSVGTYIRGHADMNAGDQGNHYYHLLANAINPGQTYYVTLNMHPQHQVAQSSNINWPNDPEFVFPSSDPTHYFDGLTRWYINPIFASVPTGFTCNYGAMNFSQVNNEPDESVSSVALSYDGTAYHADWAGPKNAENYIVNYATASMHTNGFSSGTAGCFGTPATQADAYTYVQSSCTIPQTPKLFVGIRPVMQIYGTTGNGVSPIRLIFGDDPMLSTNDQVTVASVGGNTAANGTWNVTPVPRQFFWISNSTLTSIVVSSGISTVTTASAHNLKVGQLVLVYIPGGVSDWGQAPWYTVTSVPTGTTFVLSHTGQPDGTYNSGNTSTLQVWSLPGVDLQSSTGNGAWTSAGTMTATSNTSNFSEIELDQVNSSPGGSASGGSTTMGGNSSHN